MSFQIALVLLTSIVLEVASFNHVSAAFMGTLALLWRESPAFRRRPDVSLDERTNEQSSSDGMLSIDLKVLPG